MGQYLTPAELVRIMGQVGCCALRPAVRRRMLDPIACRQQDIVFDPSCRVGSWLGRINSIRSLTRPSRKQRIAGVTLAAAFAEPTSQAATAERWRGLRRSISAYSVFCWLESDGLARRGAAREWCAQFEGRVQLILTNPPFGATYSGDEISGYAMGGGRSKAESEVLFLERYVDWLAPGGIVVSIEPDSIRHNRGPCAQLRSLIRNVAPSMRYFAPSDVAARARARRT